jgi:hypothetical protein
MDRIDEIRARCGAATPGPWGLTGSRKQLVDSRPDQQCGAESIVCDVWSNIAGNADFIAHAREDIPYLLSEVEWLNKLAADQEEVYQHALRMLNNEHVRAEKAEKEIERLNSTWPSYENQMLRKDIAEVNACNKKLVEKISSLGVEKVKILKRAEQDEAERVAAVEDIPHTAYNCIHAKNCERVRIDHGKCANCHAWQWHGTERSNQHERT